MRIPSLYRDRKGVDLQLTPMIDCVFLLMVYFIWSSSFAVAELSLPSRLTPEENSAGNGRADQPPPPEADFDKVVICVLPGESGPVWQVNGAAVGSLAELRQTLAAIARIKRDVPIVLDPAGDVPLGDAIDVFDLLRQLGFAKIQFATGAEGVGG
jgi:biopolymer transport protein ExbD